MRPVSALREAARITRREAKNFYIAFLTLPREQRLGIYALYAFFRRADDIADGPGALGEKEEALARLRRGISAPGDDPVLVALDWARWRFSIPEELLEAVLRGVEMDLERTRYATFGDLEEYCWHVAAAVGLAVLRVLGAPPEADAPGERFGIGMQLVNIVRDVKEDLSRGRVYIPQEELARFGVTEEALIEGRITPGIRSLLSSLAERAEGYLREVNRLLPLVPPRGRPCIGILARVYGRLLRRIGERGFDVFRERVSLEGWEKVWLLLSGVPQSLRCRVSW